MIEWQGGLSETSSLRLRKVSGKPYSGSFRLPSIEKSPLTVAVTVLDLATTYSHCVLPPAGIVGSPFSVTMLRSLGRRSNRTVAVAPGSRWIRLNPHTQRLARCAFYLGKFEIELSDFVSRY